MQSEPEFLDHATHEQSSFIDKIAQRFAGVAEHNQIAGLRHERAHRPNRALHDYIDPLHRYAATRRSVALNDEEAALPRRAGALARVAFHADLARHHLGDPPTPALPATVIVACLFMPPQ